MNLRVATRIALAGLWLKLFVSMFQLFMTWTEFGSDIQGNYMFSMVIYSLVDTAPLIVFFTILSRKQKENKRE